MIIQVRFDELQEADDGYTTHYGGIVKINDHVVPASGSDREYNLALDILNGIELVLGRSLTDEERQALDENEELSQCLDVDIELEE